MQHQHSPASGKRLDWLDAIKGFAILGILLNHLVNRYKTISLTPNIRHLLAFLMLAVILYFALPATSHPVIQQLLYGILFAGTGMILLILGKIPPSKPSLQAGMTASLLLFPGMLLAPQSYHKYIFLLSLIFFLIAFICIRAKAFRSHSVLAAFLLFVMLLTGTELLLRQVKPLEGADWGELPVLQPDSKSVYSLKPNQQARLRYNDYDYVVRTNAEGLPGPPVPRTPLPGEIRVLVVGDAFSMPEGLPYEHAWIAQAQTILDSLHMPVRLIDGAVTGYGPGEIAGRTDTLCALFHPNLVLYQFFVNDFEEAHLSPSMRLREIGLVKEPEEVIPRWFLNRQIFLHAAALIRTLKQKTNRYDYYFYYKSFLHLYQKNNNFYFTPEALHVTDSLVVAIDSLCRIHKSRLLVMYVPSAVEVRNPAEITYLPAGINPGDTAAFDTRRGLKHLAFLASEQEIPLLDLSPPLGQSPSPPYYAASWHWNRTGHRIAAAAFVPFLLENLHSLNNYDVKPVTHEP